LTGSKVYRLHAIDDDLDSDLVYIMTSVSIFGADGRPLVMNDHVDDVMETNYGDILSWFQLNSTTGFLYLTSGDQQTIAVDRELCSSISFQFTVRDRSSMSDEASFSLQSATLHV